MFKKIYLLVFLSVFIIKAQEPIVWSTGFEKLSDTTYLLKFKAKIESNWHLYSSNPVKGGPLPTEFIYKGKEGHFNLDGKINEGISKKSFDPIFEMELSWFDNEAFFEQNIILRDPDLASIEGEINYQACDDKVCIFRNEPFRFVLDKSKLVTEKRKLIDSSSLKKIAALKIDLKSNELLFHKDQKTIDSPLLNIFLLGFIGGIIALLTPCVFPMIPLTVSFFLKQSKIKRKGVFQALLYCFFILLIYILFSLPFHFLDSLDPQILNTISTNIFMNLFFFVVFIFFAFSFFGYYELTLPVTWVSRSDSLASIGGIIGTFFMALTLAIVSFSCTGPILGSLLVGSMTVDGGAMELTSGMAGFGIALALPFGLLALFPRALKSIPKSGGWMTKLKVTLGFLELALALKFLSNADLVAHWGILKREVFISIWLIIFIILFVYLMGWFRFPHEENDLKISKIQRLSAFLVFLFFIYLIPGLGKNQRGKLTLLSGFPPPTFYSVYSQDTECPLNLKCFKDFDVGRNYAEANAKPILLDFTGWACVNCRKMEENVWSKPEIFKLLNDEYVIISLYVDDRKMLSDNEKFDLKFPNGLVKTIKTTGEKWAAFQNINFSSASQPFYVLMTADGTILNKSIQYCDSREYYEWLRRGINNFRQVN